MDMMKFFRQFMSHDVQSIDKLSELCENSNINYYEKESDMGLHKRIKAAGASAVFITSIISLPAAAAMNPYDWDGQSQPAADRTYYISDNITVNGDFYLPENSTIKLKDGASITVAKGSSFETKGTVNVEDGASFIVAGGLSIADGSDFNVKGSFSSGDDSKLSIKGNILYHDNSTASLNGTTTVAETAGFTVYGDILLSGSFDNRAASSVYNGAVDIEGDVNLSGLSVFNGTLSLSDNASITNNGTITLSETCHYYSDGSFTNTEKGSVTDKRRLYDEDATSVSRLSLYTGTLKKGIDVSLWQGEIDWEKVKKSGLVDFAIIRSSRGPLSEEQPMIPDEMLHENMTGAIKNGIDVGVYHYCYGETVEQVKEEARFVLSLIQKYDLTFPVIFDIEDPWYIENGYTKEMLTDMTIAFCEEIKKAGYMPMVYSYASFFNSSLDMDRLSEYPVWVAHVNTDKPAYDNTYFMWQYSWEGKIDGIEGNVDLDYAYIDFPSYIKDNKLNNLR